MVVESKSYVRSTQRPATRRSAMDGWLHAASTRSAGTIARRRMVSPCKHVELQPQRRLLTLRVMKSILWLVPICILVACGSDKSGQTVNRDTLTERQKDSILANSKIPNARAVGRAMNAADSMSARIRSSDTVARDTSEF